MLSRRIGFSAAGAAIVFLAACTNEDTGVLGNGQFRYLCSSAASDSACAGSSSDIELPKAIAVGAKFQVAYAPNSSTGSVVEGETGFDIVAASPEFASTTGDSILALREGFVALLAEHVGKSTVDDFIHLKFATILMLQANLPPPNTSTLPLSAGESQIVEVDAFDANGAKLAGQLACQWTVPVGSDVVALGTSSLGRSANVQGVAGGSATVHVVCDSASVDIPVKVSGPPPADGGLND